MDTRLDLLMLVLIYAENSLGFNFICLYFILNNWLSIISLPNCCIKAKFKLNCIKIKIDIEINKLYFMSTRNSTAKKFFVSFLHFR